MPLYHNSMLNVDVGEIPCYYQHTCTRSRYRALALAIAARTNYAVLADAHQLFHLPRSTLRSEPRPPCCCSGRPPPLGPRPACKPSGPLVPLRAQ